MHEKQRERKTIRTARRKRLTDLLAVFFFLLLLPYTCSVLTCGAAEGSETDTSGAAVETSAAVGSGRYVLWEKGNGTWRISAEEFLVGALAGSIPGYYREETLKAQAVILRSVLEAGESGGAASGASDVSKAMGDNSGTSSGGGVVSAFDRTATISPLAASVASDTLSSDQSTLSYLDEAARRELWQDDFEDYEAKFTRAVQNTSGIVLTCGGQIISPPYFRLSAGQTRDSAQIWEDSAFTWCASVTCPHNLEASDYLQTVTVKRKDFLKKMAGEGIEMSDKGARMVLIRDSAGYVLFVECDGQRMQGEKFRQLFELASSNFSIQEDGKNLIFTTKGIGHGLGFDQYAADLLAGAGQDYQGLLHTFFDGVTLEKVE